MNLLDINKDIVFKEETHEYFNKKGKKFTPVSRLLSIYKPAFDKEGHITRACAKRDNITVEELKKKWEINKIEAAEKGTKLHAQIEHFIKTGEILKEEYESVVNQFSLINLPGKLHSEVGLHSNEHSLAGTADILCELENNYVRVDDIKLQKEFDKKSKYGKKMLYPLQRLDSCRLVHYSLQILLYGEMLKEHGFYFIPGEIIFINSKTLELQTFDILDLTKEVKILLKHFTKTMNW